MTAPGDGFFHRIREASAIVVETTDHHNTQSRHQDSELYCTVPQKAVSPGIEAVSMVILQSMKLPAAMPLVPRTLPY